MESNKTAPNDALYLGIDVGGTKIQASLIRQSGVVLSRHRCPTPREGGPQSVLDAIGAAAAETMQEESVDPADLTAVGLAIPGVVDPDQGHVVITPNMSLSDVSVGPQLEEHFRVPVALGNDCNLGALGESWLGSGRNTRSSIAILVGTGIGSGIVVGGRLWTGARESAGEIGHIVMEIGGPQCGCGNLGCFEALASRSAIERELRAAVDAGQTTMLMELLEGDLSLIRSSSLRRALEAEDELVTRIMRKATEVLAHGFLTVRHLIDPEVIVLGGGVAEACSGFMLPIIEEILAADNLTGARDGGHVVLSALGDDAVVLGAAALAATKAGLSPFLAENAVLPKYSKIGDVAFGQIQVGKKTFDNDIIVRVDGKTRRRKKETVRERHGTSHVVDAKELGKLCRGGPEVVFIGTGHQDGLQLTDDARQFFSQRRIQLQLHPTPELAAPYNACKQRKAALVHLTC